MKRKTNISVLDNIGLRRNINIEVGKTGSFPSGDLLDANATESLINEHVGAMTGVSDVINTKQDIISDLDTIRSGAAAGATALQQNEADELYQPKGSYLTQHQDISGKADKSEIPTKVSQLTNDSGFTANAGTITGITMNGQSKGTSGVVDLGTVIT
jgi:lactam utilization protein B